MLLDGNSLRVSFSVNDIINPIDLTLHVFGALCLLLFFFCALARESISFRGSFLLSNGAAKVNYEPHDWMENTGTEVSIDSKAEKRVKSEIKAPKWAMGNKTKIDF